MRIIYNPDFIFKGIPREKQKRYYERILHFAKAIEREKGDISQETINQFKLKKMKGTNSIFKFYLDGEARCLVKYEERDNQIFEDEPGLILLRAVSHGDQGRMGKQLDNELIKYEDFVVFDAEPEISNEINIEPFLGRNYMRTIYIPSNISDDEFFKKVTDNDGKVIYKLSQSQIKCMTSKGPVFVLGCAGSGKTLVQVCKALKNAHSNVKQAYFTFTPMLKDVAQEIYQKYDDVSGIVGATSFYCLKDFMLESLGLSEHQYFSFERFKTWYHDNSFERKFKWLRNIGAIDLWTEIRGLIKGYVGNDYIRILEINQIDKYLSLDEISYLEEQKIIEKKKGFEKSYRITRSEELYHYAIQNNKRLIKFLINQDLLEPILDQYGYIERINTKYSSYTKEERKQIHNFVTNVYQKHLFQEGKQVWYDDNDLARMLLQRLARGEIEQLDYVLVDELQDLTEMQIFALSHLAKSPNNVFMCGDVSQIINPTFFKLGRIGVLFKNKFRIDLNKNNTLNENYRNSETIVEIARELLDIRQQTLGVYSEDIREESKEIERQSGLPFFLDTDVETIIPVLGTWLGIPRVAIIVASEETKKFLKKELRIKGQTNIYTVQEVKGQEFDKIITFNIISEFKNEWEEILSGEVEKGSDLVNRYRYYFNILYVAITRGRVNLFIYEEDKDLEIINRILHLFEVLQDNFEGVMDLTEYDTEENRRIQAEECFRNEDYDRARTYYLQLNDRNTAHICKGHSYIQKGKYLEGVAILYQHPKYYSKIFDYTKGKELLLYRLIIGYKTKILSMKKLDVMVGNKSLINLLRNFIEKMSSKVKITDSYYLRLLDDTMDLMTEVYRYRVKSKINIIGSGEYYGKI